MALENCHVMSLEQLDHLWKFEFRLCAMLTGLPLRTCSARPNSALGDLFPPMNDDKFRLLKRDILKMWVRASHFFRFKNQDGKGWGIFCPTETDDDYVTTGLLSPSKHTIMGWLAKAPTKDQCPTGHRYLRSPLGSSLYLGGPISLSNQENVGRITVHTPTGNNLATRHLVTVLSTRRLIPGVELVWTYDFQKTSSKDFDFIPVTEWFLKECCAEVEAPLLPGVELPGASAALTNASQQPAAKKIKRGGIKPRSKTDFCFCPYCGMNVDAHASYSPNLKRHLSLHHAVDLVKDLGKDPLDQENPVTAKEFTLLLDKIDNVLDGLHQRHYNYQPACSFLRSFGEEVKFRKRQPVKDEEERVFQLFLTESRSAFQKYQVVYLRGVSFPSSYNDLLPCTAYTSHDQVVWCGNKPSNTLFSINQLKLSDDELQVHKLKVKCVLTTVTTCYGMEDLDSED